MDEDFDIEILRGAAKQTGTHLVAPACVGTLPGTRGFPRRGRERYHER